MRCGICGSEEGTAGCPTQWKHPRAGLWCFSGGAGPGIDTGAIHRAPLLAENARLAERVASLEEENRAMREAGTRLLKEGPFALSSTWNALAAACRVQVLRLARADLRALLAVARAAGEADILHDGPHEVGTAPKACAGCRLMRALSRASSWEGRHG
jgi:hypothetical protein